MSKVAVDQGQTIADLSLQHCGTIEQMFDMAELNDLSITDVPHPGKPLLKTDVTSYVATAYKDNGIVPATADANLQAGLGWMRIEKDFTVQ